MKVIQFFLILTSINCSYAARLINCNSIASIRTAMQNAEPGDEIVIQSGTYNFTDKIIGSFNNTVYLFSNKNGTATQPIIIRGESNLNPPTLQGINTSEGYLLSISGDYWVIQDLKFRTGSKGVVLDNSNYSKISNVTVSNVSDEAFHLRDGSSYCIIDNCKMFETGRVQSGYGEGIYVGSDKDQHLGTSGSGNKYNRNCDYNTIENCILGPNITAEAIDVKEGTRNTIIRYNTFYAEGISGDNSADSFIDLKGMYGIVHDNVFHTANAPKLETIIDISERTENGDTPEEGKTGYRDAIFNNTFNLGTRTEIATAKKASGKPEGLHIWNNVRIPDSPPYPISDGTEKRVTVACPDSWGIIDCDSGSLGVETNSRIATVILYPNPTNALLKIMGLKEESIVISIYNLQGQKLFAKDQVIPQIGIDVSQLISGTYLLKIEGRTEGILFQKL